MSTNPKPPSLHEQCLSIKSGKTYAAMNMGCIVYFDHIATRDFRI